MSPVALLHCCFLCRPDFPSVASGGDYSGDMAPMDGDLGFTDILNLLIVEILQVLPIHRLILKHTVIVKMKGFKKMRSFVLKIVLL